MKPTNAISDMAMLTPIMMPTIGLPPDDDDDVTSDASVAAAMALSAGVSDVNARGVVMPPPAAGACELANVTACDVVVEAVEV